MKKLMTLMLGAGLAFGAVTMFAGQGQKDTAKKGTPRGKKGTQKKTDSK